MKYENRDVHEIPCDELDQLYQYEPSPFCSFFSSLERKQGR